MDFNEYQEQAKRTQNKDLPARESVAMLAMGLSGEAGELTDYLKKILFHGKNLDPENIKKELGDLLWYVSGLSSFFGFTLEEVAEANIKKLRARYPEGFSAAASEARADLEAAGQLPLPGTEPEEPCRHNRQEQTYPHNPYYTTCLDCGEVVSLLKSQRA